MTASSHRRLMPRPHVAPGTLSANAASGPMKMTALAFGLGGHDERRLTCADDVRALTLPEGQVLWLDIDGTSDIAVLEAVAKRFAIHPLAMEDAVDAAQRAKIDVYADHSCIVLPMPQAGDRRCHTEQFTLIFGKGWIVTIQEGIEGDCLEPLRRRIREHKGRLQQCTASYGAYAIVDTVIDSYFPMIERLEQRIERLEDDVIFHTSGDDIVRIRHLKRDIATLRRAVWPLRDAVSAMLSLDHVFAPEDRLYLRDAYDHVARVLDMLDNARSIAGDLTDIYMAVTNNRMGEVTKVLTIIATIFMPLSFIAGVYGMNFESEGRPWNMPELEWAFGYPFALLLMAVTAVTMLLFFRRRGWLGSAFLRVRSASPEHARMHSTRDAPIDGTTKQASKSP